MFVCMCVCLYPTSSKTAKQNESKFCWTLPHCQGKVSGKKSVGSIDRFAVKPDKSIWCHFSNKNQAV